MRLPPQRTKIFPSRPVYQPICQISIDPTMIFPSLAGIVACKWWGKFSADVRLPSKIRKESHKVKQTIATMKVNIIFSLRWKMAVVGVFDVKKYFFTRIGISSNSHLMSQICIFFILTWSSATPDNSNKKIFFWVFSKLQSYLLPGLMTQSMKFYMLTSPDWQIWLLLAVLLFKKIVMV